MEKRGPGGRNVFFSAFIAVCTGTLAGFIVLAISMVLVKGLPNFWASLMTREIQFAVKLSFITSILSTAVCIFLGIPVAYVLARMQFRGRRLLNTILDIPMALPPIVSGVALLLLFGTTSFGAYLAKHGLEIVFTPKGIVLAQFFVNVPYMVRVLKSTIDDIDPRMEFVARTLGCNSIQTFFKVTLPLARNGLIAGTIITWARALGEFGAAMMLVGATRMKTETLPISLFLNMSCGELELGLAAATTLIIISLISLFVFEMLGGDVRLKPTRIER